MNFEGNYRFVTHFDNLELPKIEENLWSVMKTIIVFLNKLPEYPKTYIHEIPIDDGCLNQLRKISDYEC
jgi:hypothetical protein